MVRLVAVHRRCQLGLGGDGLPGAHPQPQRSLGRFAIPHLIDAPGEGQRALAVADAEALGDVAQDVDPAGLAGDVRIDEVEGGMEAAVAVGVRRTRDRPSRPRAARFIRKASQVPWLSVRTRR